MLKNIRERNIEKIARRLNSSVFKQMIKKGHDLREGKYADHGYDYAGQISQWIAYEELSRVKNRGW